MCVHLDGSNAENKISLLVILCIIMYVKKKNQNRYFFFTQPIMVKCLNIGKNIGQPIYRSISSCYGHSEMPEESLSKYFCRIVLHDCVPK